MRSAIHCAPALPAEKKARLECDAENLQRVRAAPGPACLVEFRQSRASLAAPARAEDLGSIQALAMTAQERIAAGVAAALGSPEGAAPAPPAAQPKPKFCPSCGHRNPANARFCMDCGVKFEG